MMAFYSMHVVITSPMLLLLDLEEYEFQFQFANDRQVSSPSQDWSG